MDLINIVNNMSDDRVRLLLLLQQQQQQSLNKVVSPEPSELPLPTTLLKPRPTTPVTIKRVVKSTPKVNNINSPFISTEPNTEPESTAELNTETKPTETKPTKPNATETKPTEPTEKLTRGKHRTGVVKPPEELSTTPIAILRRQQYQAKKNDPKFLQEKAQKAREYRQRKKLELQQQQQQTD